MVTIDPTASSAAWSSPVEIGDGSGFTSVSCPTASLCVAVDFNGNIFTSTDPTDPASWAQSASDPSGLAAVSCASAQACVAIDFGGNVLTSTNPTASGDWSAPSAVDSTGLSAISCPTADFCMATDGEGDAFLTTDPTAADATWTEAHDVDGMESLYAVSCGSANLCLSGDGVGNVVQAAGPLLMVSTAGSGSGTVSGNGISCPGNCMSNYPSGETVVLTADPASGSTFAGWSGAGCSGRGTCTVTLSADQSVTATFNVQSSSTTPPPTTTSTPPPTTTSTTAAPRCELTIRSSEVLVTSHTHKQQPRVGRLQVVAKCNQAAHATLNGKITVRQRVHGKLKTTKLAFARTSASVRAATKMVIDRTLPKRALTALRAGANESVSFTLTANNANGSTHARAATVRLRRVT